MNRSLSYHAFVSLQWHKSQLQLHIKVLSIKDNQGQNGVGEGCDVDVTRVALPRAAGRPERGDAVQNPPPVSVAVGDDGATRVAPASFAGQVAGANHPTWPQSSAIKCGDSTLGYDGLCDDFSS